MRHGEFDALVTRLSEAAPEIASALTLEHAEAYARVAAADLIAFAHRLTSAGFERLEMVTAVDREDAIELVYLVGSRRYTASVFLTTEIGREQPRVASLCEVWPGAEWQEREVYDLFGVVFEGHPDLRRMFLPDDFEGHPLRKDYEDERMIRRPDFI